MPQSSANYDHGYAGVNNSQRSGGGGGGATATMDISATGYESSHYAPIKAAASSPNASAGSMGSHYGQLSLVNGAGRERFMTAAATPADADTMELQRNASPHDLPDLPTYATQGFRYFDSKFCL